MRLECMMGVVFYLLLWSYGIRAVLPSVALPPSTESHHDLVSSTIDTILQETKQGKLPTPPKGKFKKYEKQGDFSMEWRCPHVTDVTDISCSCDIPHTVRCRGQASRQGLLMELTKELASPSDPSEMISLLDLAVHGIAHLPAESFIGLPLQGLVIRAGLQTLSPKSFQGLEDTLAALGLPANNLSYVPSDALKALRRLQRLDLSDNHLNVLNLHEFPTMMLLQNLNLAGNSLAKIEDEAFARLPQLKTLNLGGNQLDASQINEKSLWGLHFLTELSLQANLLKGTLTSTFLNAAPGLTSLDLSHNSITKVAFGTLQSCLNLRSLDLSYNKIDIIEDHAFKYLSKLEKLQLSHNQIISVSGWSLAHMQNLISLSLADNALFAVTADLLHQLPNLRSLDLASNDISLLQANVFHYTPSLEALNFADNPLHCDCSLSWFWTWLRTHTKLKDNDLKSVVCTTPPSLENAPLVELNSSDLTCSKETPDYYHDAAEEEELYELRLSAAEVSLQAASWVDNDVQLVWHVDQKAVPYTCQAVHIYEIETIEGDVHQVLAEKVEVDCSSEDKMNPHQVIVTIPGSVLIPGSIYRYCLVLLEKGTSDEDHFLPGCSESLLLTDPPSTNSTQRMPTKITSLIAGSMGMVLISQTRFNDQRLPCSYNVFVISGAIVATARQLNCSEARHAFPSLLPGNYIVCAEPHNNGDGHNLNDLQQLLTSSSNITATLQDTFPACTSVSLQSESGTSWTSGPLLILLFTLPGLGLIITIYVIGRRVWKGGGVPWRWDPRASKRAKYFLYTGETTTPTVSLDPLPVPESAV